MRRRPLRVIPVERATLERTKGMSNQTLECAIRIRDLVFHRGDRLILDHVSMDIPRGSIVAIMGPSGVGKTTILRLITGQLVPDLGVVEVNGQPVSSMSRKSLQQFRKGIGILLQNGALFTDLTVFENVATPLREHSTLPEPLIRRLVMLKLHAVGLGGTEELMPDQLSGGMARRVALARAVVMDPGLMLYDEPMSGLDPIAVSTIGRLMRETNDALGLTSVVVTHNVRQMSKLADYCYILADARIAGEGPPGELLDSKNPAVNQFMKGQVDGPIHFHFDAKPGGWNLLQ